LSEEALMKNFSDLLSKFLGGLDSEKLKKGIRIRISFEVADQLFNLDPNEPTCYKVIETVHIKITALQTGDVEVTVREVKE